MEVAARSRKEQGIRCFQLHCPSNHGHFSPVPNAAKSVRQGVSKAGAATPTVINAILDALGPLGVTDIPMFAIPNASGAPCRSMAQSQ